MKKIDHNVEELNRFADFLSRISQKKRGENVNTTYNNLRIYLIGRKEILKKYGLAPYYRRISFDIKDGIKIFYLMAQGNYNVTAATVLADLLGENNIAEIDEKYIGIINKNKKRIKTTIIRMVSRIGLQ